MASFEFNLNGQQTTVEAEGDETLLWVIRDQFGLTGTKYGCGIGQCGVCTIHIDEKPARACLTKVSMIRNRNIISIEGLDTKEGKVLQRAWIDEQVPQCGYCQSGQIMNAVALLQSGGKPSREEIVKHIDPILCRCGTYLRIVRAIEKSLKELNR